jgi:signal transduction histidine kinase
LLAGKPVQFIRDYNKRGKFKAVLDFSKLRQILLNLVSNACKFTDSGYVALDFEKVDQRLVIRVRDSGPGIPDVYRDQIFEEFFRIPSESSKKPGSGLGLTLVKSLASSMGGSVDVSPESPKGTIFTVKLPLKSV